MLFLTRIYKEFRMDMNHSVSDTPQSNASGVDERHDLKEKYEQDKADGVSYDSYKKAVNQYKKSNERLAELQAKLESYEQQKLESEGKKDEVIAQLRGKVNDLESKYKQSQANFTWTTVGSQIQEEMSARGIQNPSKAFRFAKAEYGEDLKGMEVDENYRVNRDDMQRFVDKFVQENQEFVTRKVPVNDLTPSGVSKEESKDLSKASMDDIMDEWSKI